MFLITNILKVAYIPIFCFVLLFSHVKYNKEFVYSLDIWGSAEAALSGLRFIGGAYVTV